MNLDVNQKLYRVTEQRDHGVLVTVYIVAKDTAAIEKHYREDVKYAKLISMESMSTANVLTE